MISSMPYIFTNFYFSNFYWVGKHLHEMPGIVILNYFLGTTSDKQALFNFYLHTSYSPKIIQI